MMKAHEYKLKNKELSGHLRDILDECKEKGAPVHLACEEHGEYVVIDRQTYKDFYVKADLLESLEAIQKAEEDIAAGRVVPAEEVFEELRKLYGP